MLGEQSRTGRLSSIIAQGGDFGVPFPRPNTLSQYQGDPLSPQRNSESTLTSTTATACSFSVHTDIPAIAISNALPVTDDFAIEYDDILSSIDFSEILAGITPGDFSTAFPVTCKPPDFSDSNTMGMGAGMDFPDWFHNPEIGSEGATNNLSWAEPTGSMAALSGEEWDAFLRPTSPPTSCQAHDTPPPIRSRRRRAALMTHILQGRRIGVDSF
ncbi:hypothetical protein C8Q74DRAFT_1367724 [Fomes fomentarius]|nr:hypothetical protein C8Q74DRAFT_1367724 [Fomes fomentarius]